MLDFKKTQKELYQPKTTPSIVDVPTMKFITIDGYGDPNTSPQYADAVQILYGIAYSIKMNNKHILEYVVPPLEGFWSVADASFKSGTPILDKSKFIWTMAIRQPDFVNEEIFEGAKISLAKKKPNLDTSAVRLQEITEGLCVQIMHLGSYDDEPKTITVMDDYATAQGYLIDMTNGRRHHEIYISDPRKTAPQKLKTILRHPIKKGE
ncbi:MAG: GyrI-like domain-containing protein [Defluviitaleaceae bacterium]|nr:GyrI-like domain-containing protein [Defluviitaleaceae bacterium]